MGSCCSASRLKEHRFQEGSRVVVFSEDVLHLSSFAGFNMWVSEPSPGHPTKSFVGSEDCVMVFDVANGHISSYRLPSGPTSLDASQAALLEEIGADPWAWYRKAINRNIRT